jgi:ubiquitin C-terminal hydrolase
MKQKFTKQIFISNSPAYLFINLKRFVENRKLSDESISYGLSLNIEKYCKNSKGNEYILNSIIVNQGSSYYCITNRGNVV